MRIHATLNRRARARLWVADHPLEIVLVTISATWAFLAFLKAGAL